MLIGLSLLDPLGGIGQDIVGWIGRSISQGIGGFASWAIGGVIHAMQSTTTPDFTSWFKDRGGPCSPWSPGFRYPTEFRSDRLMKGSGLDLARCGFVRSTQVQDLGIT
jgi:hypothetical protein